MPVGQTIGFRRLFFRACGPRNFMKNRTSPRGGGLSWVLGLHVFSMAYTGFSTLPTIGKPQNAISPPHEQNGVPGALTIGMDMSLTKLVFLTALFFSSAF